MRYEVPRRDRQYAAWPEVGEMPPLVQANRRLKDAHDFAVLDVSAAEFRRRCLDAAWRAASVYADELGIERPSPSGASVVATGHQAELYHCGVWIKNHLASALAARVGGSSLNCIVDNDTPRHLGLVLPVERGGKWSAVSVPFATAGPGVPFEEYPPVVEDADGFVECVRELAAGAPFAEAAVELAGRIRSASGVGRSIADVTTAVRLGYERKSGIANVELPVSRLAETGAFGAFAASILADAGRFARAYNDALARYRQENGIPNKANPLPDLDVEGGAIETPFWVWRGGQARRPLSVTGNGGKVVLIDGGEAVGALDASSCEAAAESWQAAGDNGVKIRPRALATTIFARLFLSDLFIHGIGGAKYDEVTDEIVRVFYGVEPPRYAVISATLMLPWDFEPVDPDAVARAKRELRAVMYNPQRFLGDAPGDSERALLDEKWRLAAARGETREERRRIFERIREINALLSGALGDLGREKREELAGLERRIEDDRVAFSREYCCFLVGVDEAGRFYDEVLAPLAG